MCGMAQAKAKALAEEERELSQLRTRLAAKERQWHESAAEHASTAATAQVCHAPLLCGESRDASTHACGSFSDLDRSTSCPTTANQPTLVHRASVPCMLLFLLQRWICCGGKPHT